MRLRVLGCSGGIGGRHLRTTSFLVDSDILIDAGTGVGDLSLAELSLIDTPTCAFTVCPLESVPVLETKFVSPL